jgi:hypothetical protein
LAGIVDDADLADSDLLVDAKRSCYDKLSNKKAKTPKRSPLSKEEPDRPRASGEGLATLLRLAYCTMAPPQGQGARLPRLGGGGNVGRGA